MEENFRNISADLIAREGNQHKFAVYLLEWHIQNSSSAVKDLWQFLDFSFPYSLSCYIAFRTSVVNNAILVMVVE